MAEALTLMKLVHDLKSPLSALKIVEATSEMSAESKNILNLAHSFIESLIESVHSTGRDKVESGDILQAVRDVIVERRYIHKTARISLTVIEIEEGVWSRASTIDIKRVLGNLLDNAIHAAAGLESARVEVSVKIAWSSIVIRCRDYSGGFAPKKPRPSRKNWGLGLKIVREVCERNLWALEMENVESGTLAKLILR